MAIHVEFSRASAPTSRYYHRCMNAFVAGLKGAQIIATQLLGLGRLNELALALAVREGLPASTIETFATRSRLSRDEIMRTLDLANDKHVGRLSECQSDRLVRLAETLALAADVLGDLSAGVAWLRRAHVELGNRAPLELLSNEQGGIAARKILMRAVHGIPV